MSQDWRDPATRLKEEHGGKARLHTDDRLEAYRRWRYRLGFGSVSDVDQIEWRDGRPVAVIEMTMIDKVTIHPPTGYLKSVLDRRVRDYEDERLCLIAGALGVPGFLVCFQEDLAEFYCIRISPTKSGWATGTAAAYERWLRSLKAPK